MTRDDHPDRCRPAGIPSNRWNSFHPKVWSFKDLQERSHAVAHWALQQGLVEGDVVALYLGSCPMLVSLWLGLAMVGVEAALINNNLRQSSLLHCVAVAQPRAMVYGAELTRGKGRGFGCGALGYPAILEQECRVLCQMHVMEEQV